MKKIILLLFIGLSSCGLIDKKFDKTAWIEIDGSYNQREYMVNDLMRNYLHKGMSYKNIINLIGKPEIDRNDKKNSIGYYLYFDGIDPVGGKNLIIKLSEKDSTVIDYQVVKWEK